MFIKVISGKLCYHMLIVGIFEDIWELINFLGDLFWIVYKLINRISVKVRKREVLEDFKYTYKLHLKRKREVLGYIYIYNHSINRIAEWL